MDTMTELAEATERKIEESVDHDMETIYEQTFPIVAGFIKKSGGDFEDAKDIFHDALIIYMEKNSRETINSYKAYLLGISKHLWIKKQKNRGKTIPLNDFEQQISIPDDYFPEPDRKRLLLFLKLAGKRCLDLLRAFYFQQVSVKKIAENFSYSNEHSVSAQKYKCLEKMRRTVKERSLAYDDFRE